MNLPLRNQSDYKHRLMEAWPDRPIGNTSRNPAAAAKPAAPAPAEKPPFRELAAARSAAQHARQLLEDAWPDDMSAVDKGQDDPDRDEEKRRELAEIEEDLNVLLRRKARLTGESKG